MKPSDTPFDISTHMVRAGDLDFEVDMCGEGNHLALCLHGFPEHAVSWRHQLPLLAELGYLAWAPNLRGYGNSSRPDGVEAYHLDQLTADVANLIDASGAENVTLIAHDWGAIIAWVFAIRKLRPLEKLVIMNVPHPTLALRHRSWAQLKKSWYIFFFQIPWLPEKLLGRNKAEPIARIFQETSTHPGNFPEEITRVYQQSAAQPGALTAMINYYRALVRSGILKSFQAPDVPKIEVPTLMIWGEEDMALTIETTYGTEEVVPNLTLRYLPEISHWVQQDAPDTVNALLRAFLTDMPVPDVKDIEEMKP